MCVYEQFGLFKYGYIFRNNFLYCFVYLLRVSEREREIREEEGAAVDGSLTVAQRFLFGEFIREIELRPRLQVSMDQ